MAFTLSIPISVIKAVGCGCVAGTAVGLCTLCSGVFDCWTPDFHGYRASAKLMPKSDCYSQVHRDTDDWKGMTWWVCWLFVDQEINSSGIDSDDRGHLNVFTIAP